MKIVIKLGGAPYTKKQEVESRELNFPLDIGEISARAEDFIWRERLESIVEEIASFKGHQLAIANGVGPFGHQLVREKAPLEVIHQSVQLYNKLIRDILEKYGLRTTEISPFECCFANNSSEIDYAKLLASFSKAIDSGLLPVSYGDVVSAPEELFLSDNSKYPNKERPYLIASADDIITKVGEYWLADKVIALTDVDCFIDSFGSAEARPIDCVLTKEPFEEFARSTNLVKGSDATGGMYKKMGMLYSFTQRTGIESYIINGTKKGNLSKVLKGEKAGTVIKKHGKR